MEGGFAEEGDNLEPPPGLVLQVEPPERSPQETAAEQKEIQQELINEENNSSTAVAIREISGTNLRVTARKIVPRRSLDELLKEGYQHCQHQRFNDALLRYELAVDLYPDDPRSFLGLSSLYYHLQDFHRAARYYLRAREIQPNHVVMDKFISLIPRTGSSLLDFARILYQMQELDESMQFCDYLLKRGKAAGITAKISQLKEMCLTTKIGRHYNLANILEKPYFVFLLALMAGFLGLPPIS